MGDRRERNPGWYTRTPTRMNDTGTMLDAPRPIAAKPASATPMWGTHATQRKPAEQRRPPESQDSSGHRADGSDNRRSGVPPMVRDREHRVADSRERGVDLPELAQEHHGPVEHRPLPPAKQ